MSLPPGPVAIPVDELLIAYAQGRFPMCHNDGELYWHDPDPRAVFPLHDLMPNTRLARVMRSGKFSVTMDKAFGRVIRACAEREETWIDERIIASFDALHLAGRAHSVETWKDGTLVGGIYGVALNGTFFGESMFNSKPNAGKVAFYHLVQHLQAQGFVLFDTQYINPFTRQLGATEWPRSMFRSALAQALSLNVRF